MKPPLSTMSCLPAALMVMSLDAVTYPRVAVARYRPGSNDRSGAAFVSVCFGVPDGSSGVIAHWTSPLRGGAPSMIRAWNVTFTVSAADATGTLTATDSRHSKANDRIG